MILGRKDNMVDGEMQGNPENKLQDFKLYDYCRYNGKHHAKTVIDDSIVTYIQRDDLEAVATQFLKT